MNPEDSEQRGGGGSHPVVEKRKGRGGVEDGDDEHRYVGRAGVFDTLDAAAEAGAGPQQSVEGWILIVTGIHDEATDADVLDAFNEFGKVINCTLELDRRTGYVKGYSLVEFATRKEAEKAIDEMDGKELLGKAVRVDWAFVQGERSTARGGKRER